MTFHFVLFSATLVKLEKYIPVHCLFISVSVYRFFFSLSLCPAESSFLNQKSGWSGGAMALGNLPVPGRPTIWMIVGQGPTALAVGAGGGCLDIFLLSSIFSLLSPSL